MAESSQPAAQHLGTAGLNPAHSGRVFGLDVLRALAIAGVVIPHAFPALYPHFNKLGVLGHGGFFGVELFFVLSGFLIGQILIQLGSDLSQRAVLGEFYVRRWFRTLPLFWLFFGINVAIEFFGRAHRMSAGELVGQFFFLRNFAAPRLAFFAESWSLAVEEWFYLLFPAALHLALRHGRNFSRVLLTVAGAFFLFSTIERLLAATVPGVTWDGAPRMVVINRFDALMTGVLAAAAMISFPRFWKRAAPVLFVCGFLLSLGMYCTLWRLDGDFVASAPETFFGRTFRFTLVSLGFALLLPLMSRWRLGRENLVTRGVRNIALWSYSLYLVHGPVIFLVQQFLFPEWKTSRAQGCALFAVQVGVSILLSALLYRYFEKPITRLRETAGPAFARFLGRKAPTI